MSDWGLLVSTFQATTSGDNARFSISSHSQSPSNALGLACNTLSLIHFPLLWQHTYTHTPAPTPIHTHSLSLSWVVSFSFLIYNTFIFSHFPRFWSKPFQDNLKKFYHFLSLAWDTTHPILEMNIELQQHHQHEK